MKIIDPITNKEDGFIALVAAIIVSSALLLAAISTSQEIAVILDEADHKQSRIRATETAIACLNQSVVELEHDYFYEIDVNIVNGNQTGLYFPDLNCSILSVAGTAINNPGTYRNISVVGFSTPLPHDFSPGNTGYGSVTARIDAQVLINNENISLVSSKVIF